VAASTCLASTPTSKSSSGGLRESWAEAWTHFVGQLQKSSVMYLYLTRFIILYEIMKERITRDLDVKIVPKNTRPSDFYLNRDIIPVQLYMLLVNTN
jgi:hypothetical protein